MAQRKRSNRPKSQPEVRHPLQVRIHAACRQREVTPKEIAKQEKKPRATVDYHFRKLVEDGFLRVSRKEKVGGWIRHYYVATRRAVITDSEFDQMAPAERHEMSEAVLRDFLGRCREALEEETLDARTDSHLSWDLMTLDEPGWRQLVSEYARMLERCYEIQAAATARLRKTGEEPIHTTFGLAAFESPAPESVKTKSK